MNPGELSNIYPNLLNILDDNSTLFMETPVLEYFLESYYNIFG
ncbi:hypothetical protein HMPREF0868_0946 [Mageeibacillus indolicus UPII9-5]|uniref:Uncharacterized protein n=1 Tax=Mageeibacillus indolicus (strain UPII9-5) TaxID=699246 RepID=D3R246_MAGIU|nr:hypothetical protein HMPREF0868_0946 [Mageeibacillus indolicus UPII9-5]